MVKSIISLFFLLSLSSFLTAALIFFSLSSSSLTAPYYCVNRAVKSATYFFSAQSLTTGLSLAHILIYWPSWSIHGSWRQSNRNLERFLSKSFGMLPIFLGKTKSLDFNITCWKDLSATPNWLKLLKMHSTNVFSTLSCSHTDCVIQFVDNTVIFNHNTAIWSLDYYPFLSYSSL